MTNFFVWLIAGTGIGWLTTSLIHDRSLKSLLIHICAGILGAVLTGYLATPMFVYGGFDQQTFSLLAFLLSLAGAALLEGSGLSLAQEANCE